MCVSKMSRRDSRKEWLVCALGGDHTVWNSGVWDFGPVILKVRIWLAFHVRDPRHVECIEGRGR